MRRIILPFALSLALLAAPAAQAQTPQPNPLVYVFALDGLDGDAVDAGNAPFIRQLVQNEQGARTTYFRESRSVMVAETNPNHVAMATGAYGDRSGIPGNAFAVYGDSDGDTCPSQTSAANAPTTTSGETPGCLVAESFFESIQRSGQAGDLVTAGIFGKPKLGRIFAGKKADGSRYDADYLWTPCGNSSSEDYCKQGVPNRPNDAYALFDRDVMSEVIRTVDEGVPADGRSFDGGGRRPNLTFVNFPAIDSAGHGFGRGPEYDAAVGMADDEIERFVAHQKQAGLWERTVMVLLSDHSMDSTPEKSTLRFKFEEARIPSGAYKIVQNGSAALVYLTDRDDPNRFDLLRRLRAAALGGNPLLTGPPAVEALYRESNPDDGGDANTVAAVHPGWRLTGERVGDLVVSARKNASFNDPINPLAGNHGGPQTRDNFLAVSGGASVINQRTIASGQDDLFDDTLTNPDQSENVDVAPTVTRLLSQRAPAQNSGRFLSEAFNSALLPPAEPAAAATTTPPPAVPAACAATSLFRSAPRAQPGAACASPSRAAPPDP